MDEAEFFIAQRVKNRCRSEAAARSSKWRKENIDKSRRNSRNYARRRRSKIPDVVRTEERAWKAKNPARAFSISRDSHLKYLYGITTADKDHLLAKQKHRCVICRQIFKHRKDVHIDHCHKSGRVRGILCGLCNRGLGQFRDSPKNLERAAAYLRAARRGG